MRKEGGLGGSCNTHIHFLFFQQIWHRTCFRQNLYLDRIPSEILVQVSFPTGRVFKVQGSKCCDLSISRHIPTCHVESCSRCVIAGDSLVTSSCPRNYRDNFTRAFDRICIRKVRIVDRARDGARRVASALRPYVHPSLTCTRIRAFRGLSPR